jgi:regulatory protein YycI of two-component signal transduction system YycFG
MIEFLTTYLITSTFLYFLPFIISLFTGNRIVVVLFINLFLGWTFIGWIWALFWAVSQEDKKENIIINNNISNDRIINPIITEPVMENLIHKSPTKEQFNEQKKLDNIQSHQDKISQIQQLKSLLDNGIVTKEEFEQQKTQILSS